MAVDTTQAIEDAASWWAGKLDSRHEAKQQVFELALLGLLLGEWVKARGEYGESARVDLEVDYDPCLVLQAALRIAGIECRGTMNSADGIFPFKTKTRLLLGRHVVRWLAGVPVETTDGEG